MTNEEARKLVGTYWRNKRTGTLVLVGNIMEKGGMSYLHLQPQGKGGRSRWKWAPHLPFDYDKV